MDSVTKHDWDDKRAIEIVSSKADLKGALLPILNALQDYFGYIQPHFVPVIANMLNLSRADVHGVITFYHDYRDKPLGRKVIKICRAEACQSMQAQDLIEHVKTRLGIDFDETSLNGEYSLESTYCLGNCACAPAIMIDKKTYGRVSLDKFDKLIATKPNKRGG